MSKGYAQKIFKLLYLALGVFAVTPSVYAAVPKGAIQLLAQNVFITSIDGKSFTCGKISTTWAPGTLVGPKSAYFLSYATEIKNTKVSVRTSTGTKKKKMQSRIKLLTTNLPAGNSACKAGIPTGTPALPTATPPASTNGNFDSVGNVTAAGKSLFGIPMNLSANITQGKAIYNVTCIGCHLEHNNRTFSSLRNTISRFPMSFDSNQIPDSDLAQIIAYLNRFDS